MLDRDIDNLMAEIIETSIGIKTGRQDLFKAVLEHGSTLGISEVALSLAERNSLPPGKRRPRQKILKALSEAKELRIKERQTKPWNYWIAK